MKKVMVAFLFVLNMVPIVAMNRNNVGSGSASSMSQNNAGAVIRIWDIGPENANFVNLSSASSLNSGSASFANSSSECSVNSGSAGAVNLNNVGAKKPDGAAAIPSLLNLPKSVVGIIADYASFNIPMAYGGGEVEKVACAPGGRAVVFQSKVDKKLRLLDVATGKVVHEFVPSSKSDLLGIGTYHKAGFNGFYVWTKNEVIRYAFDNPKSTSVTTFLESIDKVVENADGDTVLLTRAPWYSVPRLMIYTAEQKKNNPMEGREKYAFCFNQAVDIAFGPDRSCMAIASRNSYLSYGSLRLMDHLGRPYGAMQERPDQGRYQELDVDSLVSGCMKFSSDGKWIALSGYFENKKKNKSAIVLYNLSDWLVPGGGCWGELFLGHPGPITALAFSPDGSYFASGSQDKTVRLWDVKKKKKKIVFEGHEHPILSLAFSEDGTSVVSADKATVCVWQLGDRGCSGQVLYDFIERTLVKEAEVEEKKEDRDGKEDRERWKMSMVASKKVSKKEKNRSCDIAYWPHY